MWKLVATLISVLFTLVCIIAIPSLSTNMIRNYKENNQDHKEIRVDISDIKVSQEIHLGKIRESLARIESKL